MVYGVIASIFSPSFRLDGMSGQVVKAKPFGFAPRSLDLPALLMPRYYRGDGERSGEDTLRLKELPVFTPPVFPAPSLLT